VRGRGRKKKNSLSIPLSLTLTPAQPRQLVDAGRHGRRPGAVVGVVLVEQGGGGGVHGFGGFVLVRGRQGQKGERVVCARGCRRREKVSGKKPRGQGNCALFPACSLLVGVCMKLVGALREREGRGVSDRGAAGGADARVKRESAAPQCPPARRGRERELRVRARAVPLSVSLLAHAHAERGRGKRREARKDAPEERGQRQRMRQ